MKQIFFYEWSDVNRVPIKFTNLNDFINFCNMANITINKRNINFFNSNNVIYAICKYKKSELTLSKDLRNLKKNISKHRINYITKLTND